MNWDRLFYWVTIADNVHVILVIITTIFGILTGVFGLLTLNCYKVNDPRLTRIRKYTLFAFVPFLICGLATLLSPDEDDVILMIAGTAVGTVLDSTYTYDELPDGVEELLSSMIQKELENTKRKTREYLKILNVEDTLRFVYREDLYEIITLLSKPYRITPSISKE
jgi:hypothetical protein